MASQVNLSCASGMLLPQGSPFVIPLLDDSRDRSLTRPAAAAGNAPA